MAAERLRRFNYDELIKKHREQRDELQQQIDNEENPKIMREELIDFLSYDVSSEESCMSLPHAMALLAVFAVMVQSHFQTEVEFQLQNAIKYELENGMSWANGHLSFYDVIWPGEFFAWFSEGVIPRVWDRDDSAGNLLPAAEWDRFLKYNKVVGSVRLIQERSEELPCTAGELGLKFYGTLCHDEKQTWSTASFGYCDKRQHGELVPCPFTPKEDTNLFEVWLDALDAPDSVALQFDDLKNARFIDQSTKYIEVRMVVFNAELATGILGSLRVKFEFQRGGAIKKFVTLNSFHTEPYHAMEIAMMDVFFFVLVFQMTYSEMKEMVPMIVRGKFMEYMGFWNIIDWMSIIVSFIMLVLWIIIVTFTMLLAGELDKAETLERENLFGGLAVQDWAPNTSTSPSAVGVKRNDVKALKDHYELIYTSADEIIGFVEILRMVCAIFCLVLIFRFFKSFAAQPKLAQVTDTIYSSGVDIIHFFFVFSIITLCYCIAGMVIFGTQLFEFSTLTKAFMTSFKTLMGDFDFEAQYATDQFAAFAWFWSFNIVVLLVMLNMLLAIVMDEYSTVKSKALEATTLWAQTSTLLRRQRENKLGTRRELSDVLAILEGKEWRAGDTMSPEILVDNIENLPMNQAKRIMDRCKKWLALKSTSEGVGLSNAITQVCHIDQALHVMCDQQLELMQELSSACDELAHESTLDTQVGAQKLSRVLAEDLHNPYLDDIKDIMLSHSNGANGH
jgi:hypothetical protein